MPVTTILQHAMEREVLGKADMDTRMSSNQESLSFEQIPVEINLDTAMMNYEDSFSFEQRPTEADLDTTMTSNDNNLSFVQIASKWVHSVESHYPQISPLSKANQAATAASSWISPNYPYRLELLNGISSSNRPKKTRPSSRRTVPQVYHTEQINPYIFTRGGKPLTVQQTATHDIHQAGQTLSGIDIAGQACHQTQQGMEVPPTSYYTQLGSSASYNTEETSSNIYTTAEAAYNALQTHNVTRTSLTSHSSGQTSPTDYHTAHSSPTSCDTAQTSLEAHNAVVIGAENELGVHAVVSGAHPIRTTYPPITSAQSSNPRTSDLQPTYQQTETKTVPQRGGDTSQRMAAAQPERTSRSRSSATTYPVLMPRPAAASQETVAPVAAQLVYPQPTTVSQPIMNSQPVYSQFAAAPQSTMSIRQNTIPQPVAISQPSITTPRPMAAPRPTVVSQGMAAPRRAETSHLVMSSHLAATPRLPVTSQPAYSEAAYPASPQHPYPHQAHLWPPAASQPSYLQPAYQQRPYLQHDYTRPPTAAQLAADRRESRRLGSNREGSSQVEINRAPYNPNLEGSSIIEMQPSAGNSVLQYLMQHNPSLVAASQVSNEIPKRTARKYKKALSQQVQKPKHPYSPADPSRNRMESIYARSDSVPATVEVHYNAQYGVPAQHGGIEPATGHGNSTLASQQVQGTEAHYHPGHYSVPTSHNGVQSHSYPIISPERMHNEPHISYTYPSYMPESQQQSNFHSGIQDVFRHDGQANGRGSLAYQADIQEISREDWQVANKGDPGRRASLRDQSVAGSLQRSGPLRPWTPTTPMCPQPISRLSIQKSESEAPSLRNQHSVPERTASANTQAAMTPRTALLNAPIAQTSTGKSQEGPAYSGIQNPSPAGSRQDTPLFSRYLEALSQAGDPPNQTYQTWEPPVQAQQSSIQAQDSPIQVQEPYVPAQKPNVPALEPTIRVDVPMFVSSSGLMPPPSRVLERSIGVQAPPELVLGSGMRPTNGAGENSQMRSQISCSLPRFDEAFSHALSVWPLSPRPQACPQPEAESHP